MFDLSFNTKQFIALKFNRTVETHMNAAIQKIADITKGEGNFIFEYIIWEEEGTTYDPKLNPKLMFVRGYNFKENRTEDARYRLKNKGTTDPAYSNETNLFLYNNTSVKPDRKTVTQYALEGGIAVDNMFIVESVINGITYYGNFDFMTDTIYGSTIINSAGKRQGRFVMLADEIATQKIDNFNKNEDTGLKIMQDLLNDTKKAIYDKD
jgi:hypothetical protein